MNALYSHYEHMCQQITLICKLLKFLSGSA